MTDIMDTSSMDAIQTEEDTTTQMSMVDVEDENTRESTQSSIGNTNGEVSRKSKVWGTRPLPVEVKHIPILPSQIIEYEWPLKSGKKFFIQEQIAQLLDVSSFKRKFPELSRRSLDVAERKYLIEEMKIAESLPLHLLNSMTVLEAGEVHNLMSSQYPDIYEAYNKSVAEKLRQSMLDKQKQLEALANDKGKLAELRSSALKNCSNFNKTLIEQRKDKSFFDQHTQIIMVDRNRYKKLKPEHTRPAPYPVALVEGQYTSIYKKYTPEELKKFPIRTVMENDELFPVIRRERSPPPFVVSEAELLRRIEYDKTREKNSIQRQSSNANIFEPASPRTPKPISSRRQSTVIAASCSVCKTGTNAAKQILIQCHSCLTQMHPECLEMPLSMIQVIKHYDWTCIDCKKCTVCMKPDQEESMMCCDICDRGYHTFCVGLASPPTGTWICNKFCEGTRI